MWERYLPHVLQLLIHFFTDLIKKSNKIFTNGSINVIKPTKRSDNLYELPKDIPMPIDDGACDHLPGSKFPSIPLLSTNGEKIDVAKLSEPVVLYCHPRTGLPDRDPPLGWNEIPGARGCTPQSLAYRDSYDEFKKLGFLVFGMSVQSTEYQKEAAIRLQLPFPLLSDENLALTNEQNLPTFKIESMKFNKRLTLIIHDGVIVKVFYPIFPTNKDPKVVLTWILQHRQLLGL
jgi:peroxiredoxin